MIPQHGRNGGKPTRGKKKEKKSHLQLFRIFKGKSLLMKRSTSLPNN
jgi:hypothetical protein